MNPVNQIEFRKNYGDCFRACVASIFEFPIQEMPNFWEETQDAHNYWELTNVWTRQNLGVVCVSITIQKGHNDILKDLLCVALGKQERSDEEHAVVWENGLLHDPHPSKAGIINIPDTFTVFIPTKIHKQLGM